MSIRLMKADNGENLLLGTFTNNRIDREGQILTDAAHKEYVSFLNEHPERAPALLFWHIDDTDLSQSRAKAWFYNAGFLSMVWEVSEKSAEFIRNFDELFNAGMSHGFNVLQFDESGDIEQYRSFEASILPLDKAANLYTNIEVLEKEQKNMTPEQMKIAMQSFGSKAALAIAKELEQAEALAAELDAANVTKKEYDEPEGEAEPTPTQSEGETVADEAAVVDALTALDSKIEQLIADHQAKIDGLVDQLANLQKEFNGAKMNGQSRASLKHFTQQLLNGKSVVGNDEAKVDGRSSLAKSKPQVSESNTSSTHALAGIFPSGGN